MPVGRLDHYSIRTLDIEASRRFYTGIMGFTVGFRPPFDFPGIWLYNGVQYPETTGVVHIIGIDPHNPQGLKDYLGDRDPASLQGTGTVDHMAFTASDLKAVKARFDAAGLKYELRRQPGRDGRPGTWQLFSHDPNGARVELDFDAAESP